jgi:hypothetical protein
MPQKDPNQTVTGFQVDSPVPARIETDSEGNSFVYLEVANPPRDMTVAETFNLTRREEKSGVDANKTRPLTDEERNQHAKYLAANTDDMASQHDGQASVACAGGRRVDHGRAASS